MTPDAIDSDVKKLIELLGTNTMPVYLDVKPEPYSQVVGCFPAVKEKISRDGGTQELGWQIWKTDIIVEAEFHAVWKSPDGKLIDITPKQISVPRILFLPAPGEKYNGSQVDNIRINITQNRLVDDFVEISKAIFRIENKGDRAFEYELKLNGQEAHIHETLNQMKTALYVMIMQGLSRNSPCFCQSGKKYKHCHGNKLDKALNRI
ncbi:MAG TPA: zinc chelation protein SecC [Gammaproteobacteria bacterium]|nr:zinc chelation protein SecC [Gammaproteobacteria bacterium]